ncbi:MAG: PDZ domain-containing protein [Actinomycetales bacterium]
MDGGPGQAPPAPQRPRDGRFTAMIVSGALALALVLVALILPVPYVIESPGPTFNTLGKSQGKPVIQVSGHETYAASGNLDLVTVYVKGGPQSSVNIFDAFRAWLNHNDTVVPEELLYAPGTSSDQVAHANAVEMTDSQENATAAAMTQLKIPYTTQLSVFALADPSASRGKLDPNDVLTTINGAPITDIKVIQDALAASAGKPVTVGFTRNGTAMDAAITPQKGDNGTYLLGVQLQPKYTFPFNVDISLANVGGPSAGMMFALGIIDTLTPGDLTGGKHFAGTGTIDPTGAVGPIGGIAQKMVGARSGGATVFFAPATNCNEVVGHVPAGLQVVKVSTLQDAYNDVKTIAAGKDASALPTCSAN